MYEISESIDAAVRKPIIT